MFVVFRFKKPKRKVRKIRQKLKADDLMPLPGENLDTSAHFRKRARQHAEAGVVDTDDVPAAGYSDMTLEEDDDDLEQMLSKARRLKQKEALISKSLPANETQLKDDDAYPDDNEVAVASSSRLLLASADNDIEMATVDNHIILNATAEFCRTLGDIPTYGMSGNRDEDAGDMMDYEVEPAEAEEPEPEERSTGTWNSVNPDLEVVREDDKSQEVTEVAILDEEPDVGSGMGAALKLALSKGYLEKEDQNRPSNTRMAHLQAKNYSIEDKT